MGFLGKDWSFLRKGLEFVSERTGVCFGKYWNLS